MEKKRIICQLLDLFSLGWQLESSSHLIFSLTASQQETSMQEAVNRRINAERMNAMLSLFFFFLGHSIHKLREVLCGGATAGSGFTNEFPRL